MKTNSPVEKTLKRIIKSVKTRDILKCAHFSKGDVYATDSHQLVRFANVDPLGLTVNLNLEDFSISEFPYPDVESLIPKNFGIVVSVKTDFLLDNLPLIKALKGAGNVSSIEINSESKKLIIKNKSNFSDVEQQITFFKINILKGESFKISFNLEYLANALESIKDLKILENTTTTLKFEKPSRPFLIQYFDMDYLITPVRTF